MLSTPPTQAENRPESPVAEAALATMRQTVHSNTPPVQQVFDHWRNTMQQPDAHLDPDRKNWIKRALEGGFTIEQLNLAITGCSKTPYNMGKNPQGERYNGLHVILKNAEQIERFMRHATQPPEPQSAPADSLSEENLKVAERFMQRMQNDPHAFG